MMKGKYFGNNFVVLYLSITILLIGSGEINSHSNSNIDSLKRVLSFTRNAQDSAAALSRLIWGIAEAKLLMPDDYQTKSFQLLKRIKNQETIAELYDAIALTYRVKKNVVKAKEYYSKALEIGNKYNYKFRIGWENYNLAEIYLIENNRSKACIHAKQGRIAFKQLKNTYMTIMSDWRILNAANNYRNAYVDTTIEDYKYAVSITTDRNILLDEYLQLTYLYEQKEDRSKSMSYALKALDLAEKTKNERAIVKVYYQIGNYLKDYQHNYETALLYYQKILEISKRNKIAAGIASVLIDIGETYKLMGKDSLALSTFYRSLDDSKKINHRHSIANAYRSIGNIFYSENKFKEALEYYTKCYNTGCDVCPEIAFHQVLVDMGKAYLNRNEFENAKKYFNKSLCLADSSKSLYEKAVSLAAIGDYYKSIKNTDEAIYYYENAFKLAASSNSLSLKKEITAKLSSSYNDKKDYQNAYRYLLISNIIADSLNKITQVENISRLESKFELQNLKNQKEQELKENQIRANAEIDKQALLKYFFITGFVLMSVLGFVLYRGIRQKRRDNKILEEQKKQIEEMSAKVHKADEEKISFFTNISHELRTPLTLILGPLEKLVKENRRDEKITFSLGMIRRNALQLYSYINQLLDIRKLDTGNITLKVSEGDLKEYCKGLCSTFSHLAEENNIVFGFNSPKEKITGWFDRDIIEKALNNLLSNAFKYTPKNGIISVCLEEEKSFVKIIVSDNGKGIPGDQLQYVFDRYYQVENSNTGFNTGTGIGLAYTKELIELHKGTINVESRLNSGTTFTITLQINESCYEQNEKSTNDNHADAIDNDNVRQKYLEEVISKNNVHDSVQEPIEADERKKVLLIAEDNADLRAFIKNIFESEYKICEAPDGLIGYQMASEIIPDVIISDIMMPGMNGLELCNKLKKNIHTNHIPILILTAKAGEENEINGLKTGADDYLTKPFQSEILKVRIARLIEAKEKLKEYFTREFLLNPSEVKINSPEDEFLRKAVKVVEDNIANPNLNVELLMQELAVSRTQLFRKLKAITNYSANQFIRNIKLKRAAQLLRDHSYNITEVLYLSGFNSHSYFTSCFKEVYGCLPKDYSTRETEKSYLVY
jgi:signal transduction histidine kinase/DNA-binding response OmpR family regulator